jgi:hypothetical protein
MQAVTALIDNLTSDISTLGAEISTAWARAAAVDRRLISAPRTRLFALVRGGASSSAACALPPWETNLAFGYARRRLRGGLRNGLGVSGQIL